jgi:hypothetical protein
MIGLAISLMVQATLLMVRLTIWMLRTMIVVTVLLVAWAASELEGRRARA